MSERAYVLKAVNGDGYWAQDSKAFQPLRRYAYRLRSLRKAQIFRDACGWEKPEVAIVRLTRGGKKAGAELPVGAGLPYLHTPAEFAGLCGEINGAHRALSMVLLADLLRGMWAAQPGVVMSTAWQCAACGKAYFGAERPKPVVRCANCDAKPNMWIPYAYLAVAPVPDPRRGKEAGETQGGAISCGDTGHGIVRVFNEIVWCEECGAVRLHNSNEWRPTLRRSK